MLYQASDETASTRPGRLQPVPLPDRPWEKVGVGTVAPFKNSLLRLQVCNPIPLTDYYFKWPELAFSHTVIRFLTSVFCGHGNPENIVTDNGPQFTSTALAWFLHDSGISHSKTSVYHPAANGVQRSRGPTMP